ncbi:acyl-CoA dehydrogenase family protein [Cupriavidus metallidurans]|uniref:acyl-CoA dehydrogenase family protein n=1 Tax=Cupriavidus metallidurans TaxID=119219 RepID=UPI001BFC51F6|nr:acyl-CoA dehydrogenase family protein [Cupriavidus metallidurans]QWC92022.1 acyl-CoA dehydrogenase [Cupriavidus metallidurans]
MYNEYSEALEALLRDHCTPAVVRQIESGGSGADLWRLLDESGFADSLLPEAGLSLADVAPMLFVMGRHVLPVPLAQTMFARAVLRMAGVEVPEGREGPIALADFDGAQRTHVPCGATATWFLVQDGAEAALVHREAAALSPTGVRDDLTLSLGEVGTQGFPQRFPLPAGLLRSVGACLHAVQMAGAMSSVFDLTLQYANDRAQFGRNIGKFQAIQHQISVMAEQVAAVRMAAQIACAADGWQPDRLRAAIGKFNASDAVTAVTSIAHAVHGAIGVTAEYDLQLYTRRLHAWRLADGSERYWARELGEATCEADGLTVDLIREWSGEAA